MAETTKEKKNTVEKADIKKFAVIRTGGKQYIVRENDVIEVELLKVEAGKKVDFEVLLVADGDKVEVGTPLVTGAKVSGSVVEDVKGKKLVVFKFRRRKNYRVKTGHRQKYTQIKIDKIG